MLRDPHAFAASFRPLTPAQAGTGRLLGGPPDQVAAKLYAPPDSDWPRLRLSAYPTNTGPVVFALVKDDPDDGWDVTEPPDVLRDDVQQLIAEAEARLAAIKESGEIW